MKLIDGVAFVFKIFPGVGGDFQESETGETKCSLLFVADDVHPKASVKPTR